MPGQDHRDGPFPDGLPPFPPMPRPGFTTANRRAEQLEVALAERDAEREQRVRQLLQDAARQTSPRAWLIEGALTARDDLVPAALDELTDGSLAELTVRAAMEGEDERRNLDERARSLREHPDGHGVNRIRDAFNYEGKRLVEDDPDTVVVEPAEEDTPDRAADAALALLLALLVGISRRRTSTAATLGLAVLLSRVHAARARRLEATLLRLFDERQSVHRRLGELDDAHYVRIRRLERDLDELLIVAMPAHGGDRLKALVERRGLADERQAAFEEQRDRNRAGRRRRLDERIDELEEELANIDPEHPAAEYVAKSVRGELEDLKAERDAEEAEAR